MPVIASLRTVRWLLAAALALAAAGAAAAPLRIGVASYPGDSFGRGLAEQLVAELQPLLGAGAVIETQVHEVRGSGAAERLFAELSADAQTDLLVSVAFGVSSRWYREPRFAKPTYLLNLLDPALLGEPTRERERNLRWYSVRNEVSEVFSRIEQLFGARRVAALVTGVPGEVARVGQALQRGAAAQGMTLSFAPIDVSQPLAAQIPAVDAVIVPPLGADASQRRALFAELRRRRLPSYVVAGDELVREGALISDTQSQGLRVLARRAALDIQARLAGEGDGASAVWLPARPMSTINLITARQVGVDFDVDQLLRSRLVRDDDPRQRLGIDQALGLALERGFALNASRAQRRVDAARLAAARAAKRPQLSAALGANQRGEQLPERSSQATLQLSQVIYSASANAAVDSARLALAGSEFSLDQQRLQSVADTAAAFFGALAAQAQQRRQERALTLNEGNLSLAVDRRESGSGAGADVYRWQASIAAGKSSLVQAYADAVGAQSRLAALIDLQLPLPLALDEPSAEQPPFDLLHEAVAPWLDSVQRIERLRAVSAARAQRHSPQLAAALSGVGQAAVQLAALERSYYTPELLLNGQASRTLDSSALADGSELDGQRDWQLALQLNLPLWLGGARAAQIDQASGQREQAQWQYDALAASLNTGVVDAVNGLLSSTQMIEHGEVAERAATRSLEITRRAYQLGAAGVTELLDAQNAQLDAAANTRVARFNYLAALVEFQALGGAMPMLLSGAEQRRWLADFERELQPEEGE